MNQNYSIKKSIHAIIFLILMFNLFHSQGMQAAHSWWDEQWEYRISLDVPIDTSLPESIYQPIDQLIIFKDPCWAKDEQINSIRVCCFIDNEWHELESQIYDLTISDDPYIQSCRIIFLIPEYADGTESYYVYYSDSEKPNSEYPDHVSIEESYYHYEPISGYPLESYYYKILDDKAITYIVSKEGQFMGYNTGQHITKMLPNTTEVFPKNGDLFAAFDFKYCYADGLFDYSSTSQKLISKEIFVDGNLMTSFGMVSESKLDDLKTTVHYTYYHCPTSTTRIRVHVKHETLESITVDSDTNTDGTYATLQSGGAKSSSIEDLNIGEILPYMNFINDYDEITTFKMDLDPEYIPEEPDIRVAEVTDDLDLGDKPWISFNEGDSGLAHAILFYNTDVLVAGDNEENGIQLNAFQMDYPHLPGLENNMATIQVGRNSYEPGTGHDVNIPAGFIAEFDAEFFTHRTGGRPAVEKESTIYHSILNQMLQNNTSYDIDEAVKEKYELSVIVHQAESFPMGSAFAALTGINFSFITVELYHNDIYHSSETAVRLPMNALDQEIENVGDAVRSVLHLFDIRNISLFKKVTFQDIYEGNYTVKIIRENYLFSKEPEYIGFGSIKVTENNTMRIVCTKQKTVELMINDQNDKPVPNTEVYIKKDEAIVSKGITDTDGNIQLSAPYNRKGYQLQAWYKGVNFYDEPLDFSFFNVKQKTLQLNIDRYTLDIEITDKWDLPPGITLQPILLNENGESIGHAEQITLSHYFFTDLPPAKYSLVVSYKSVTYTESFDLTGNKELFITFPAEFTTKINVMDNRAIDISDFNLEFKRETKDMKFSSKSNQISVDLPPGKYQMSIFKEDELIGKRDISVNGDGTFDVITSKEPLFPLVGIILSVLAVAGLSFLAFKRLPKIKLFACVALLFLLISPYVSWWSIAGSTSQINANSELYLIPGELISYVSSTDVITGSQAYLPEIFDTMILGLLALIIVASIMLIMDLFIQKKLGKFAIIIQLLVIVLFIAIIGVFTFGMTSLSEVSVGTFIGSGELDVSIPGQNEHVGMLSTWGPSIGYYSIIIAMIVYVGLFLYQYVFLRFTKKYHN